MSYIDKAIDAAEAAERNREPLSRALAHVLRQSRGSISAPSDKDTAPTVTAPEAVLRYLNLEREAFEKLVAKAGSK